MFYYTNVFNFFSLSHIRSLLIPCAYVSIESIDCILLSLCEFKAILLISSVKALYLSFLNLCWVFNTNLIFSTSFLWSSLRQSTLISFSSKWFTLFIIWEALNSFYNPGFNFSFYGTLFCLFCFLLSSLLSFK